MNMKKRTIFLMVSLLSFVLVISGCNTASKTQKKEVAQFPTKPITLVVPFAAGGVSDLVSRQIAQVGKTYLNQPINVVNRPGGSGTVGTNEVVSANPDGYTLLFGSSGELSSGLHVVKAPYDLSKYTPLAQVGSLRVAVAVKRDAPWNTLKELVDYAKQNPGKLSAGIPGEGTVVHLTGVNFSQKAGISLTTVPFQGSGQLIPSLLGGHVDVGFLNVSEIMNQYKAGEAKILAVFADTRVDAIKDVPTAKEQGIDVAGGASHYIVAPNGLPENVAKALQAALQKTLEDAQFRDFAKNMGYQVVYSDTDKSKKDLQDWYDLTGKIYSDLGMMPK
ncbi:Bug family tripartite tricarboxylate transporter substrate binding protein [Sporomusa acidovorans]|uniref:Tripartite tricarboxylate transporter family receptor n=1 Tax=Sporomusa acidovorans (strain ATCC 49682 / DSM 3132 / Mol) TaxID=1123286 RepID=A0ABZ3IXI8_SPOA4|nr:tripartite tricarboxylate transporter substrate binding protein [Sporomusa acidovorans]OZC23303.1 tripartite tricarboxylate transporter family receptor [Sporomusa acidovorans DSM 3132]SDE41264.1 Tripartite-type tricarboxylate transporter, receptor component TctC [Sporomusa acidovorans]